jgi:hypothetical protein
MKPKYLPMAVTALGNGVLHRAIVSLPEHMTERDHPMQERIVFFETPSSDTCARHLEQLLAAAWCVDTKEWCENGYIYNVHSAYDMKRDAFGDAETGELYLFEIGAGGNGEPAVGPQRIRPSGRYRPVRVAACRRQAA